MSLINPVARNRFHVVFFTVSPVNDDFSAFAAGFSAGMSALSKPIWGGFTDVQGLTVEMEAEEYREGGYNLGPRQFPKYGRYPNLIFKRGVIVMPDLWDWHYQAMVGSRPPIRKSAVILLSDPGTRIEAGPPTPLDIPFFDSTPIAMWFVSHALPRKVQGPELNASDGNIAIESLEVVHQGLFRIGAAQLPSIGGVPLGDAATALGL